MSWAYYNDNDPFVCNWLQCLINKGLIPDGAIDSRSIVDVVPADLGSFRQCHFFAGIGGWARALALAGYEGECWTASLLCQPLSVAGARQGALDGRHLWPAFYRLVEVCRPPIVFGEQVASKDGREWLAGVRIDLEELGYACGAANLPACSVGAPHRRERLYWGAVASLANPEGRGDAQERERDGSAGLHVGAGHRAGRGSGVGDCPEGSGQTPTGDESAVGVRAVADARLSERAGWVDQADARQAGTEHGPQSEPSPRGARGGVADADGRGFGERGQRDLRQDEPGQQPSFWDDVGGRDEDVSLGDAERAGLEGHAGDGDERRQPGWLAADPRRPAGAAGFWDDAEWRVGADGKARRVKPGIRLLAHGVPNRVGALRGLGNSLIPTLAKEFIMAFLEAIDDLPIQTTANKRAQN